MHTLQEHIDANINLPSPPAIAVRIIEAVQKEETSFDELAAIITADPALSSRILRVANSSFYALPSKVDSIQRALAVIGSNALKNIALSFVIAGEMRAPAQGAFDYDFFWKRSVTAAVSGDLIAALIGKKSDDVFVTALLQDIGVAIMYLSKPDEYAKVLDKKRATGSPIVTAEIDIFGFDHQEIGMAVLKKWGLPPCIYEPVGNHHTCNNESTGNGSPADVLNLSDKLSSMYHGARSAFKMQEFKKILNSRYGIDEPLVDTLVDQVAERSVQILSFFEIDPGDMKPFSQMLQRANEELGKANLSYEQLVIELKQAKDTAENLARELQTANDKLRALAFRDGLTGLYNHRFFQEHMDREVSKAIRYQRPLSLIMFDLDHFKQFNDQYGHPVGDKVLKATADTILETVRTSDVVARYGGEEFAAVLPETGLKGAVILAERMRQRVEQLQLEASGRMINITISLGVSTWEPGADATDKAAIIDAADRALYKSKKDGRNKTNFVAPLSANGSGAKPNK